MSLKLALLALLLTTHTACSSASLPSLLSSPADRMIIEEENLFVVRKNDYLEIAYNGEEGTERLRLSAAAICKEESDEDRWYLKLLDTGVRLIGVWALIDGDL